MSSFAFCAPSNNLSSFTADARTRALTGKHVCHSSASQSAVTPTPAHATMSLSSSSSSSSSSCSSVTTSKNPKSNASLVDTNTGVDMDRRAFLSLTTAAVAGLTLGVVGSPEKAYAAALLTGDYPQDAATVLADMRVACDLARGTPGMSDTVGQTRKEMNEFVALYRRNNKVAGSTSFSTLYTAINTLSGHYASYGNAYPVPEKRKKRLSQQFTDIDRALNRGR